jgi:hypothetical protein
MKKLGAILFGIVFILGLSIETTAAQQFETVDPDGIVSFSGAWAPVPSVERLNDWDSNPDASSAGIYDEGYNIMRLNFEEPKPGSYTTIKVKLRVNSASNDYNNKLNVRIFAEGTQLGDDWTLRLPEILDFTEYPNEEYPNEWLVNMTAAQLADLQVEIEVTEYNWGSLQFSAIQVELVSEDTDPIPEVTEPIQVTIDYRPYRSSNSLNYRSRGTVRVVIFGSADFDVSRIDRESLRLAGVAPVRERIRRVYSRTDRARDEYEDLVLKFKTKQLIKALEKSLEQELENGDQVPLNLTGNLKDDGATPIEGEDTAVVFGKRHKHKKKGKWKNHWKWWR